LDTITDLPESSGEESTSRSNVYQLGGSLSKDFPTYVIRPADDEIYNNLKSNNFCYVLGARQMGKSSLRVRTMDRLIHEGYACASVDLTLLGSKNTTANQWYYSFLYQICRSLRISASSLKEWWTNQIKLTHLVRLNEFFEGFLLQEIKQHIVIFIDEIDSLLSLDSNEFNTDDFFASLRAHINARADNPDLQRLNFVILGVATPNDLMHDPVRTPFNVGIPIHLSNFKYEEAKALLIGLHHLTSNQDELLKEVMYWTGGQPVLSQKLCKSLAEETNIGEDIKPTVKRHIDRIFLSPRTEESSHNLANVQRRILESEYNAQMIGIYERILSGTKIVVNNTDNAQLNLQLTGLVQEENGFLVISNRIYKRKFNKKWLLQSLQTINRPFAAEINYWLENQKSDKATELKNETIESLFKWSTGRTDLSTLEREFIDAVRNRERKQKSRKNKILYALLIITVVSLVVVSFLSIRWAEEKRKAYALKELSDSQKDSLKAQNEYAQELMQILKRERDVALELRNEANKQKDKVSNITEALRYTSTAQEEVTNNPTKALNLALKGLMLDQNGIILDAIHRIYRDNSFYRIIAQNCSEPLAFTKDAKYFACATDNNTVSVFNLQGQALVKLKVDNATISAIAISNNANYILTAHQNNAVYLWGRNGNRLLSIPLNKSTVVTSISFSPDNNYFVTCHLNNIAQLWNMRGQLEQVLTGHIDAVQYAVFSPDSKSILTCSWDKTAKIWNLQGKTVATLIGHSEPLMTGSFSSNGAYIITGSRDKTVKLWNKEGEYLRTLKHNQPITVVEFSPDAKYILTGTQDNTVLLWDLQGSIVQQLKGHSKAPIAFAFAPNASFVVTASLDSTVRYWDLINYKLLTIEGKDKYEYKKRGHSEIIISAAISPDNQYILTGSRDSKVILWDKKGKYITEMLHKNWITAVSFSRDGQYILTASSDSTAIVWDKAGNKLTQLIGHDGKIYAATFSPDNKYILTGSSDKTARIWSVDGKLLHTLRGHSKLISAVAISPDNKIVATASDDNSLCLWQIDGRKIKSVTAHKKRIESVVFNIVKQQLITSSSDGYVKFWNYQGEEVNKLELIRYPNSKITLSADGTLIFIWQLNNNIQMLDINGYELQTFKGDNSEITCLTTSGDKNYILLGYNNNSAILWRCKKPLELFLNTHSLTVEE